MATALYAGLGYCGDTAVSVPAEKQESLVKYRAFLGGLGVETPNAVPEALSYYSRYISASRKATRDSGFLAFRRWFYQVIECLNKRLWEEQNTHGILPRDAVARVISQEQAHDVGLAFIESEGYILVGEERDFLLNAFFRFVSPSLQRFLAIRSDEMKEIFQEDGAICVSLAEVGRRCVNWEKYLHCFPKSALAEEARKFSDIYMSTLLTGTTNTYILNNRVEDVNPERTREIRSAYEYVMNAYPSARISKLLCLYLPLLERSQYCDNNDIHAFLNKNGVKWMFGSRTLQR
jgi:hypothetical protein